jgi:outer membrane immunogenic protein
VRCKLPTLLAVLISIGGPQLASAAPPAAQYNWAGWYVGGNIGYGLGVSSDPTPSFVDPGGAVGFAGYFAAGGNVIPNLSPKGVIGGGQVGINWMLNPSWVAGLVADFQGSGMRDATTNTITPAPFPTSNQYNSEHIDWFGTVRAKIGLAQNNWLFYATGGLAYGGVSTSGSFVTPPGLLLDLIGSSDTIKAGWAAGAGLNYALTSNWIVGVEYLYVDLGHVSYTETQSGIASSLTINNRAATNIARVSLDHKF